MGNLLKDFVEKSVRQIIQNEYTHLRHAAVACAKVVKCTAVGTCYQVSLRMLDKAGQVSQSVTEIPGVWSETEYNPGETVVIIMPYGEISQPYIVGRRD